MTRYISDKARRLLLKGSNDHAAPDLVLELQKTISAPLFYVHGGTIAGSCLPDGPIRLPANPCWIEYHADFCVLFCDTGSIEWVLFVRFQDGIIQHAAAGTVVDVDGGLYVQVDLQARPNLNDNVEKCVGGAAYVATIVASLSTPPSEVPLSSGRKMYARQGRGRVFKHYEVDLAAVRAGQPAASHGGTHASPAWHIRRGHMRRLKDGRTVFVRSCEVGSKERGVVLKDYVASSATVDVRPVEAYNRHGSQNGAARSGALTPAPGLTTDLMREDQANGFA